MDFSSSHNTHGSGKLSVYGWRQPSGGPLVSLRGWGPQFGEPEPHPERLHEALEGKGLTVRSSRGENHALSEAVAALDARVPLPQLRIVEFALESVHAGRRIRVPGSERREVVRHRTALGPHVALQFRLSYENKRRSYRQNKQTLMAEYYITRNSLYMVKELYPKYFPIHYFFTAIISSDTIRKSLQGRKDLVKMKKKGIRDYRCGIKGMVEINN